MLTVEILSYFAVKTMQFYLQLFRHNTHALHVTDNKLIRNYAWNSNGFLLILSSKLICDFSSCILPLVAPWLHRCLWIITSMQMTLNFSFYPSDLDATLLSSITLYNIFLLGWLQTYWHETPQKPNSSHWTQAKISHISQLPDRNYLLCSQSRHNLWWTPHLLWPNIITIQILLFSYPCTSLYQYVSRLQNSFTPSLTTATHYTSIYQILR